MIARLLLIILSFDNLVFLCTNSITPNKYIVISLLVNINHVASIMLYKLLIIVPEKGQFNWNFHGRIGIKGLTTPNRMTNERPINCQCTLVAHRSSIGHQLWVFTFHFLGEAEHCNNRCCIDVLHKVWSAPNGFWAP